MPQIKPDVEAFARIKVLGIGGSGGGYHVTWAAAQGTISAAVSLSGVTDLEDALSRSENPEFASKCDNYGNGQNHDASPVNHVTATSSPMLFVNETKEAMPLPQLTRGVAAWTEAGVHVESLIITGSVHSFAYWGDPSPTGGTISSVCMKFLNTYKNASPTPTPTP